MAKHEQYTEAMTCYNLCKLTLFLQRELVTDINITFGKHKYKHLSVVCKCYHVSKTNNDQGIVKY